jgi:hypothetical protein
MLVPAATFISQGAAHAAAQGSQETENGDNIRAIDNTAFQTQDDQTNENSTVVNADVPVNNDAGDNILNGAGSFIVDGD